MLRFAPQYHQRSYLQSLFQSQMEPDRHTLAVEQQEPSELLAVAAIHIDNLSDLFVAVIAHMDAVIEAAGIAVAVAVLVPEVNIVAVIVMDEHTVSIDSFHHIAYDAYVMVMAVVVLHDLNNDDDDEVVVVVVVVWFAVVYNGYLMLVCSASLLFVVVVVVVLV